jgi:hypothetical protein
LSFNAIPDNIDEFFSMRKEEIRELVQKGDYCPVLQALYQFSSEE